MNHQCVPCNMSFKCKKYLTQHLKCSRHTDRVDEKSYSGNRRYSCNVCGKKYSIRQSLHAHRKLNSCVAVGSTMIETPVVELEIQNNLVSCEKEERIEQNAIMLETIQQKYEVQGKNIEALQKKIEETGILLQSGARHESTSTREPHPCQITPPPQYQKSRDKRKKINKDVRRQVVDKQGNACGMCKLVLTPYFEIDHTIGLQFGGTDDESNLMALCRECHAKKSIKENQCRERIKEAIQTIVRENLGIDQRASEASF